MTSVPLLELQDGSLLTVVMITSNSCSRQSGVGGVGGVGGSGKILCSSPTETEDYSNDSG